MINVKENNIILGDCIEWLKHIPSNSIDLCYIDPPFCSNKDYEIIWNDERRSFGDRWKGGVKSYIVWMEERVKEIHRVLKPTGSIFLHCDWHASHRLRVMLDDVFGEKNFVNEIIHCYTKPSNSKKSFPKNHQNIFWYSKGNKYIFKQTRIPHKSGIHNTGQLHKSKGKKNETLKNKLESKGKKLESWWVDIWSADRYRNELIGYKTQKPEALLKRVIECSTNEGDVVLDCFGGSGTTASVASQLNRKFITGDVSPAATKLICDRLNKLKVKPKFNFKDNL